MITEIMLTPQAEEVIDSPVRIASTRPMTTNPSIARNPCYFALWSTTNRTAVAVLSLLRGGFGLRLLAVENVTIPFDLRLGVRQALRLDHAVSVDHEQEGRHPHAVVVVQSFAEREKGQRRAGLGQKRLGVLHRALVEPEHLEVPPL